MHLTISDSSISLSRSKSFKFYLLYSKTFSSLLISIRHQMHYLPHLFLKADSAAVRFEAYLRYWIQKSQRHFRGRDCFIFTLSSSTNKRSELLLIIFKILVCPLYNIIPHVEFLLDYQLLHFFLPRVAWKRPALRLRHLPRERRHWPGPRCWMMPDQCQPFIRFDRRNQRSLFSASLTSFCLHSLHKPEKFHDPMHNL